MILGDQFELELENLVQEFMQSIHDGNTDCKEYIVDFIDAEPSLREQCWDRLERYEQHCEKYRKENGLQPFQWQNETSERVRDILDGKYKIPLSPDEMHEKRERIAWLMQSTGEIVAKNQQPLPEYSGNNHPLYISPNRRTDNRRENRVKEVWQDKDGRSHAGVDPHVHHSFDGEAWEKELDERWPLVKESQPHKKNIDRIVDEYIDDPGQAYIDLKKRRDPHYEPPEKRRHEAAERSETRSDSEEISGPDT